MRAYGTLAGEFVAFVNTCGGLTHLDADVVGAFVATLSGYQVKTVEQKLCAVRSFVRFASADGLVDAAVLDAVPAVRSSKQTRIPSVWDPGDVARILDAVDRGTRAGNGTTRSSCWSPGSGCAASTSSDWSSPTSTGRATG